MIHQFDLNTEKEGLRSLHAGDLAELSGVIYTGRDAAHKRMLALIRQGQPLPFDIKNQIIYYVGPCPAKPGMVIGSAGPTTSGRMDAYTPELLARGLLGMIGKGERSPAVVEAIRKNKSVYLGAIGGAGALLASCIEEEEVVAFEDLGTEAIRRLRVVRFPVTVLIDSGGASIYQIGRRQYAQT